MNAPISIVGTLAARTRRRRLWRRLALFALFALFAVLALFPQQYRATTTIAPTDPNSFGLGGATAQLGAANTVFGNQSAVEIALKVGKSIDVRRAVARQTGLAGRLEADELGALRWLEDKVTMRSLRGGMVVIEHKGEDPVFGERLIRTYAEAVRTRLGVIARGQTTYKRSVLQSLVDESSERLARAQAAYDTFRLKTRYSAPVNSILAIGERIPVIEAAIKQKDVQLRAALQFATADNISVRQLLAQREALQAQLAQARAINVNADASVGRVVQQSTEAEKLERELGVAKNLFLTYRRFLEGTAVEDMVSTASVRVIEPPHVDSARQINLPFAVAAALVLLLALATEFYEARPPVGIDPHRV